MCPVDRTYFSYALALTFLISFLAIPTAPAMAQNNSGEPLLEVPLHNIPEGMSYEEYEDANRRISLGMAYAIVPGGVHFYAGEEKTGWILAGSMAAGLVAIVAGVSTAKDKETPESDFDIVNDVDESKNHYEKIPIARTENGETVSVDYRLRYLPPEKDLDPVAQTALVAGVITIVGSYLWDIFHGIHMIETKRSKARYKWGLLQNAQARSRTNPAPKPVVRIQPMIDPQQGSGGVQVELKF